MNLLHIGSSELICLRKTFPSPLKDWVFSFYIFLHNVQTLFIYYLFVCALFPLSGGTKSLQLDSLFVPQLRVQPVDSRQSQAALRGLDTKDSFDSGWRAFYSFYLVFPSVSVCMCSPSPPPFHSLWNTLRRHISSLALLSRRLDWSFFLFLFLNVVCQW